MGKRFVGLWRSPAARGVPALVVAAVFFALGGALGSLFALQTSPQGRQAMADYLERFLAAAQGGSLNLPELPALLWRSVRWPLAAFLMGFSALGLVGVPVVVFLRGFFLAFSISSFAQAYGFGGLTVALFLLGIPALAAVPAFFLLSVQSLSSALSLAGGNGGLRDGPFRRDYFICGGVCAAVMGLSLLMERYLVPVLVTGLAGTLVL